jgi:cytochrome bd ubiquinol oxidase subunit II
METIWFILVAFMLTAYVLFDGFDLGAGIIYLVVARTNAERRAVLRTIGPVWDGNEVWLLSAGGTLFFAFPRLYASSFSGFYLPLTMVLWLLMLRAIGIEFRSHIDDPVWSSFFDAIFSLSSALLAVVFGAALGNVVRGVPLGPDGYFFEPLWTNFTVANPPGILDWFTVLAGVVALSALTIHGALYVAHKTEGPLSARATGVAIQLWPVQLLVTLASLVSTCRVNPGLLENFRAFPLAYAIPLLAFGGLGAMLSAARGGKTRRAFTASSVYLASMLGGAAYALYPVVLPATSGPGSSLTIYNTSAGRHGLQVGLAWWPFAAALVAAYFVFVYRMFAGKVQVEAEVEAEAEAEGEGPQY